MDLLQQLVNNYFNNLQPRPQAYAGCMKKLRNQIKHKYSTGKYLKWFKAKHRPCRP